MDLKVLPILKNHLLTQNSMCVAPILIPNPYRGIGDKGINYLHDTSSAYIRVPCGSCPQCISMRQGFFNQRVQMESFRSYLFMFTLTYNDESLVYVDCKDYHFPIPCISDVQNMFKRLRRRGYKFRYTYVSEYGTKRHRPHFHGILAIDKSLGNPISLQTKFEKIIRHEWRRNYSSNRWSPNYKSLSTDVFSRGRNTTFDFHYIEPVPNHDNDVSFYVSKYITKYDTRTDKLMQKIELDDTLSDEETSELLFCLKPRRIMSKDFGSWKLPQVQSYIKDCLSKSSLLPQFYDLYTGKACLLSPYYRRLVPYTYMYKKWLETTTDIDNMTYLSNDDKTMLDYANQVNSNTDLVNNFEKLKRRMKERFGD